MTIFAGCWRFIHLGRPARLVFDETYYVKQAYSLLHLGYEGVWNENTDTPFAHGDFTGLTHAADYVVHPPLGKWMIASAMAFFEPQNPVGWRLAGAIVGALSVGLLVLIGRHLFGHIIWGATAGVLLAVDGMHVVMSRVGILDIFLSFWVVGALGAVVLDQRMCTQRLTDIRDGHRGGLGIRWWLIVAGFCLGAASAVKWSGIYFTAAFGLLVVAWGLHSRWVLGMNGWFRYGIWRDGLNAFFTLIPTALATYLATWIPWMANPHSYMRYHTSNTLSSLWAYHQSMWEFHTTLNETHTYQSHPAGWLFQARPTSFAWQLLDDAGAPSLCGADTCAASVLALGNPLLWWAGLVGLVVVLFHLKKNRATWGVLAGYVGGYLPWFLYPNRTMFTFYTVVLSPFVALAVTFAVSRLKGRTRTWVSLLVVGSVVGWALFYWPVWTGAWIPYWQWQIHMLFPSWI